MGDLNINISAKNCSNNETNFINLLLSYGSFTLITLSITPTSATIIDHTLTNDIKHNTKPMALQTVRGGVEDIRLEAKAKDTKKSEAKAKDSLSEDRTSRGQGQEGQGPKTQAQAFSKKKKKTSSKIFFRRSPIHWRTQNF